MKTTLTNKIRLYLHCLFHFHRWASFVAGLDTKTNKEYYEIFCYDCGYTFDNTIKGE